MSMASTKLYTELPAGSKRELHPKIKRISRKTLHIIITFILGVALATTYHLIITSRQVRKTAEAVCEKFGRDEQECKDGIDNVLDESDGVVDNNLNVTGGE